MIRLSAPLFNDTHLFRMCDDTGIYQHAKFDVPNPHEGYTTDDNARLMMVAAAAYEATGKRDYLDLTYRGMSFLQYAYKDGWFHNFMSYDRRFLDDKGSEDCVGRSIWGLGYINSRTALPIGLRRAADELLAGTVRRLDELNSLRANAYAVMGLCLWNGADHAEQIEKLLKPMLDGFTWWSADNWQWFEDKLAYCNAVIPHALFTGASVLRSSEYFDIAVYSLDFLLDATVSDGRFMPVGCNGWYCKDGEKAMYDQQPVEACATMLACLTAHRMTGDSYYLSAAALCLDWFGGMNTIGANLICPKTGGCYDGITCSGLNLNRGAESLLSWYGTMLGFNQYIKQERDYENSKTLRELAAIRRRRSRPGK